MKKVIIVCILLIVIIALVPLGFFLYNKMTFSSALKNNGYIENGNIYFNDEKGLRVNVTKYNIFSKPEFSYENMMNRTVIEFHDLNDSSKNYIYPLGAPTNISNGKKMTLQELEDQLKTEQSSYRDAEKAEEISKEEWLELSEEYVEQIKAEYNSVVDMLK